MEHEIDDILDVPCFGGLGGNTGKTESGWDDLCGGRHSPGPIKKPYVVVFGSSLVYQNIARRRASQTRFEKISARSRHDVVGDHSSPGGRQPFWACLLSFGLEYGALRVVGKRLPLQSLALRVAVANVASYFVIAAVVAIHLHFDLF